MNRAENLDSIPRDLIIEILSRLPSKSVGRFHCVSKLWRSMLSSPYFKEGYLTKSSARPRLLFAINKHGDDDMRFYSSPQPQIPYEKPALVVAANYHTIFRSERCTYASGLICFPGLHCLREDVMPMICNPITGQYVNVPKVIMYNHTSKAFLGFDPVYKQFKILVEYHSCYSPRDRHKILTLSVPKHEWRSNIVCPRYCDSLSEGICISGVIYYVAHVRGVRVIVCFDVRHEEFKVIEAQCFNHQTPRLVNYKGKLGGIIWESGDIELRMWVLERQEWSNYVYPLPENDVIKLYKFVIAGMTTRGEFVLSMIDTFTPFYVLYFNPEKNTLKSVEIQGFRENVSYVKVVFVDHVEDFNFLKRESS